MTDTDEGQLLKHILDIREQLDRIEAGLHPSIYRPADRSEADQHQALKDGGEVER